MSYTTDSRLDKAELALLAMVLVAVGMFIVPCHWTSIWGDREFTAWVTPIAKRMAAGQRLYAEGAHSPMAPLPFVLMSVLFGEGAVWIDESFLNFLFQALTIATLYLGLRRCFPRPVVFFAALGSVPVFFSLPKTIVFDAQTQLLVAVLAVATVRWVESGSGRSSPDALRRSWPLLFLAIATAACILSKQSTGAGAAMGVAVALTAFPRTVPLADRVRRAAIYGAATLSCIVAMGFLLSGFISPRGLLVDVFLTGSEPKGGSVTLLHNVAVFADTLVRNVMLPTAFIALVAMGPFVLSWRKSGRPYESDPDRHLRSPTVGKPSRELASVVGLVGALAGLVATTVWPPENEVLGFLGYSPIVGVLPAQVLGAGLLTCFGIAVGTMVRRDFLGSPGSAPLDAIAVLTTVTFPAAVLHNVSVKYLRWTYDNNPFILVVLIAVFYFISEVPPRLTSRPRLSRSIAAALVALMQVALWTEVGLGNQIKAVCACTETWPEVEHLSGARLRSEASGMRALVHDVRRLAKPNEAVLLLPEDPNVEAWFERPRPDLSSAIIFVDQYWDRYVDSDFERLKANPPKVIVIGPRRHAPHFQSIWHPGLGASRLMDRIQREILPELYRLEKEQPIEFKRKKELMDVYVRVSP